MWLLLDDFMIDGEEGEVNFKEVLLSDDRSNPELSFVKEMLWNELLKAIDELPIAQKEVFPVFRNEVTQVQISILSSSINIC